MASKDKSGRDAASIAGRLLKHPEDATKKDIQTLSGSVLVQVPDSPPKPKTKPKTKPKPKRK